MLLLRTVSPLCLGLLAASASCTTVPPGVVSIEARGGAHSTDVWYGIANAFLGGSSGGSSSGSYAASSNKHDPDDDENWHSSLGLRAAISTPVVDLIGGADKHRFDNRNADEVSYGLRKRFSKEGDKNPGYVLLLARHGEGLHTDRRQEDYDGVAVGIGALTAIDEHWFIDVSLEAEWLWNQVEIKGNDTSLFSLMLGVGIGFAL